MKPVVTSSDIAYENPWFRVRHDELIWANGKPGDYYVVEFRGGVCLVCIRGQEILTIQQYRHAIREVSLELPAGRINPQEAPEETATRELQEETGHTARSQKHLGTLWSLNGATRMALQVYYMEVEDTPPLAQKLDDAETGLKVTWMPITEWRQAIREGRINDAESIAAWTLYTERVAS